MTLREPSAHLPAQPPTPCRERRFGPIVLRLLPASHPSADLEVVAALVGLVGLLGLWLLPLEALTPFAGECRFREWTGIPCATCGTTRAIVALGAGRWAAALRLNPLVTLFAAAGALYTIPAWVMWRLRLPRPRVALATRRGNVLVLGALFVLVGLQWIFLIWDGR